MTQKKTNLAKVPPVYGLKNHEIKVIRVGALIKNKFFTNLLIN